MSLPVEQGDEVFCDLQEIGCFLRRRNPQSAVRFVQAVRLTFGQLGLNPQLGRLRTDFNPEALRSWPVNGFSSYLIFYFVLPDSVRIWRVLHGGRDLKAILND